MSIWKLTPLNPTSNCWDASIHKDYAIVRAANEHEARTIARKGFSNAIEVSGVNTPGNTPWQSPWENPAVVSCQRLEDSTYEEGGPAAVFYPTPTDPMFMKI